MHQLYNANDYHVELDKLGKIIIYLRKSREDLIDGRYASDEETLARHEAQLQQWAEINLGHRIPADCIYKEVESGEKIKTRPVFQEVLKRLENDNIDGLLAINCSRLSRGDLKDCGTVIDIVKHTETLVLTPQKIYNLKNRYDMRFFKDELLRGNDYLEANKEQLGNGRHWSTSVGKYIYSSAPFGYDRVTCKEMGLADGKGYTLRQNADADIVRLIFDMYEAGEGCYKIASHLKAISAPTRSEKEWDHCKVKQVLDNVSYIGLTTYGKRKTVERIVDGEVIETRERNPNPPTYKGLHTAIISDEQWQAVQARRATHEPPVKRGLESKNPLMGIVRCASCGKVMVRKASNKTTKRRKHPLDKAALQSLILSHLVASGMPSAEFARRIGISAATAHEWTKAKEEKFYPAKRFIEKWETVKGLLKITNDSFDAAIYEFEEVPFAETLACNGHQCKNMSINLEHVEKRLFAAVQERLNGYRYFVDNYAEEITKQVASAEKARASISKQITAKEGQIKKAKIAYEKGVDTIDEYIERKQELLAEIAALKEKREALTEGEEAEKSITIKKAVPVLDNVIACYFTLSAAERNELLKTIVESVMYARESKEDFALDICWII